MYRENAERILLQSVAAATMSAHLPPARSATMSGGVDATARSCTGRDEADARHSRRALRARHHGVRPAGQGALTSAGKPLDDITNWNGASDPAHHMSDAELDDWIQNQRHKVMYKDASKID
ncbi:MAG: hypothetical protein M9905_01005 [Rhizobiaceae bacterium]|nr:hypothetical protein [Rhizobiaceae bacterium]